MTTIPSGCTRWQVGEPTMHPPFDSELLTALQHASFTTFSGPIGLCGGRTEARTFLAIHRGRGQKWELIFREHDTDMVTAITTDLAAAIQFSIAWLRGEALSLGENSLRAAVH